ncbi:MAG: CRISPR-associated endonuclease Cas2 [Candidatus Methanomethylicota archaeon]|jgi:CRISPR-associated protein Cas2|uniref:CRISPR-associated endoribonuclease Cas2 n=1 Tax=Thermoproteota archaeon TaxID=2056631 RepID=A0A523BF12_9CREN|nr:MAG: CRISPR-associated endonuclease Cas2 [Candidatus Verstraetearchaeota archaeon]
MITLVIYDIADDSKRTKLSNHIKQYGLRRIQYSGFKGDLNPNDRHVLIQEVSKFLSGDRDSIYVIPLCTSCAKCVSIISKRKGDFVDEDWVKIV